MKLIIMTILCMSNFAYSVGENDANNLSNTDQALTVATNNSSQLTISDNNPLNEANVLEKAAALIDSMQSAIENSLTKYYEDGAFINDLPFALSAAMFLIDPKSSLTPIHLFNMVASRYRGGSNPIAGPLFYSNALFLIASADSSMAPVHIAVMALNRKL